MKKKELKNLATKIAKLEKELQTTSELSKKQEIELEIMKLTGCVSSIDDISQLDDMVIEILSKK